MQVKNKIEQLSRNRFITLTTVVSLSSPLRRRSSSSLP